MTHLQVRFLTVVNHCSSITFLGAVPVLPLAGGLACYFWGGQMKFEYKIVTKFCGVLVGWFYLIFFFFFGGWERYLFKEQNLCFRLIDSISQ